MGRKRVEVNPLRGERLNILLSRFDVKQKDFADKMGYTEQHISKILNGKANLTHETAVSACNYFNELQFDRLNTIWEERGQGASDNAREFIPQFRVEWLMCYDDLETTFDSQLASTTQLFDQLHRFSAANDAVAILAFLSDYHFVSPHSNHTYKSIESFKKDNNKVYQDLNTDVYKIIHGENAVGTCSQKEFQMLVQEIMDFVEFRINKICKGGVQNGQHTGAPE